MIQFIAGAIVGWLIKPQNVVFVKENDENNFGARTLEGHLASIQTTSATIRKTDVNEAHPNDSPTTPRT
jgi:hypothetical protein